MSAERNPDRLPDNAQRDLIQRFNEEYSTAMLDVEVSARHTETEGWQNLYANQRKLERERRRKLADDLRNISDRLELRQLVDEEIKEIADIKKAIGEDNDSNADFDSSTVDPVRRPVDHCNDIVNQALNAAKSDEERTPLINVGLEHMMKLAVAKFPTARWQQDRGIVEIVPAK